MTGGLQGLQGGRQPIGFSEATTGNTSSGEHVETQAEDGLDARFEIFGEMESLITFHA